MKTEQYFPELILEDKQINKLHNTLLDMIVDIDYVCRKYNINYSLAGGTCLGAVRHKGFIPWDDDVDILIFKEDKNRLYECILKEFPEKYEIADFKVNGALNSVDKIILKGTKNVELMKENWPINNGIFIDIFTWDNTCKSKIRRNLKAKLIRFFYLLFFVNMNGKYPPKYMIKRSKSVKKLKRQFILCSFVNFFIWYFSPKFFLKVVNWISLVRKQTDLVCVPQSAYGYNKEVFKKSDLLETIDADFEGHKFKIYKNYDMYLTNLYGDYMQLPPEDKRHRHLALELKFREGENK